jgi:AbrB family looped-hinge helix DNA binding protein
MNDVERRRVGERGQVTLPKGLREAFDIGGGDEVEIRGESGKIVIEKPITREDFAAGYRARADRLRDLHDELEGVSKEADEYLGDVPEWE